MKFSTKALSNFKDVILFSRTKKFLIKKKKKDNSLHMVLITEKQKENHSIKLPAILEKELKKYFNHFGDDYYEEFCIYNEGMSNKDIREGISLLFTKDLNNKENHIFVKKMLYVSFVLLNIKKGASYINLNKDIFEKFKLKEDKDSLLKLYDILKFANDIKLGKRCSNCLKYIFGLK